MVSLQRHELEIAGRRILLDLPADPESLLNAAATHQDSMDPYWGILWDAARHTAACVLRTAWQPQLRVLEIGCGAGLVGVAGLLSGLHITFSDHVPDAVQLAVHNAAINGFGNAQGQVLDWHAAASKQFDFILASDVLYERRLHQPLLKFVQHALPADGFCCIGDPGRQDLPEFLALAKNAGWHVRLQDAAQQVIQQPQVSQFCWIQLSR
jgi:predicted nicotinamide N-methyase